MIFIYYFIIIIYDFGKVNKLSALNGRDVFLAFFVYLLLC